MAGGGNLACAFFDVCAGLKGNRAVSLHILFGVCAELEFFVSFLLLLCRA